MVCPDDGLLVYYCRRFIMSPKLMEQLQPLIQGAVHLTDEPGVPHILQHIGRRSIFKREFEGSVPWPQTKIILSGLRDSVCAQTLEKVLCHALAPGYASLRALSAPSIDEARMA